jgi:GDP-L-fucose synthase
MNYNAKIYIAGHTGLVGSALVRKLQEQGYTNLILRTHQELNLTDQQQVINFFSTVQPEFVFLAAAKVGGIGANNTYPADFIYENLQIQNNIIHSAFTYGVKKLLFLGSSCIYPKLCPQPIKEEYLLTGPLEKTNEPYALAKISGIKLCQSFNRQYGTNFIAVMPTNLYGPGDNFDPERAHVVPALLYRFHQAKINQADHVVVWGTGTPRRELLYVDDMAEACIFLMGIFNPTTTQNELGEIFFNVGSGTDLTIKELVDLIKQTVGFEGKIIWDTNKPDGTPVKRLDISKISMLGWRATTDFFKGLRETYEWFCDHTELWKK